jgi:paraquat-inducible protein B
MSKAPNPALIGGFVLSAVALLALAVLFIGAGRFSGEWVELTLYFRHDVGGLRVGAPVVVKGVQIGGVSAIKVEYDADAHQVLAPVKVRVDESVVSWPDEKLLLSDRELHELLVERGLRAKLVLQSFVTGRLMVELGFFPQTPAIFHNPPGQRLGEIPTVASDLDEIKQVLQGLPLEQMAKSAIGVLQGFEKLVNDPAMQHLAQDARQALGKLERLLDQLNEQAGPLSADARSTLDEARQALHEMQTQINSMSAAVGAAARSVDKAANELGQVAQPLSEDLRRVATAADKGLAAAQDAFTEVSGLLQEQSPLRRELLDTLRSLADAARALRHLADYLERHPEALLRGKS